MRIDLDHNATTPLHPDARAAMEAVLREIHGNPSSVHAEGAAARAEVEAARARVAALLGVASASVRFTSGATEANNTVLLGSLEPGDHVVTTQVEHPSVLEPLAWLERRGVEVERVSPDRDGCVEVGSIEAALTPRTKLVALIWAQNEIGAIQPVEAVAALCRERGVAFHVDATQALGKCAVDLGRIPFDFASVSAHKIGGPKGVGALVAARIEAAPVLLHGGGQERGGRGGTENVAGIAGFGAACEAVAREGAAAREVHGKLRDRLWQGLAAAVGDVHRNGDPDRTLSNTLNVELRGTSAEVLVQTLDLEGVAASAGAACHSGSLEPSKVLLAMGRTPEQARASVRFSIGRGVDEVQVDRVVSLLREIVPRLRALEAP